MFDFWAAQDLQMLGYSRITEFYSAVFRIFRTRPPTPKVEFRPSDYGFRAWEHVESIPRVMNPFGILFSALTVEIWQFFGWDMFQAAFVRSSTRPNLGSGGLGTFKTVLVTESCVTFYPPEIARP